MEALASSYLCGAGAHQVCMQTSNRKATSSYYNATPRPAQTKMESRRRRHPAGRDQSRMHAVCSIDKEASTSPNSFFFLAGAASS